MCIFGEDSSHLFFFRYRTEFRFKQIPLLGKQYRTFSIFWYDGKRTRYVVRTIRFDRFRLLRFFFKMQIALCNALISLFKKKNLHIEMYIFANDVYQSGIIRYTLCSTQYVLHTSTAIYKELKRCSTNSKLIHIYLYQLHQLLLLVIN